MLTQTQPAQIDEHLWNTFVKTGGHFQRTQGDPTNLEVLLFTKDPTQWVPGAYITVMSWWDGGQNLAEKLEIRGSVLAQYHQLLEYLTPLTTSNVNGVTPLDYGSVRDAVLDSLVGRDYRDQNPVLVTITPLHVKFSYSRKDNPELRDVFKQFGSVPDVNVATTIYFCDTSIEQRVIQGASICWFESRRRQVINWLQQVLRIHPSFHMVTMQVIEMAMFIDDDRIAKQVLHNYTMLANPKRIGPYLTMSRAYTNRGATIMARKAIQVCPPVTSIAEFISLIIAKKRLGETQSAHALFKAYQDVYGEDPQFLHEFAQIKVRMGDNVGAEPILREAISRAANDTQRAWMFYDLSKVIEANGGTHADVHNALVMAQQLRSNEPLFQRAVKKSM